MEKRIFLAIVISIGFLWLWAAVAPKLFPELAKKEPAKTATTSTGAPAKPVAPAATATTTAGAPATTPAAISAAPAVTPVVASKHQLTVVDRDQYTAVFSNRGAQLISFRLKSYTRKQSTEPVDLVKARSPQYANYPFFITSTDGPLNDRLNKSLWSVSERDEKGARVIEFRYAANGVSATKTFRFGNDPYLFSFAVQLAPAIKYRVGVGPGIRTLGHEEKDTQVVMTGNGVLLRADKFKVLPRENKEPGIQIYDGTQYIGVEDNYFLTALRPSHAGEAVLSRASIESTADKKKERRVDVFANLNAASDGAVSGDAFFGPKETSLLDRYGFADALQFGWFGMIARFFLSALSWIYTFTKNWGFAIIVLTILIKIVLYPLQHKSIVSMKKMQRVQPKVEAIKSKYKKAKTDPEQRQKMNVEMMQLYQKEGINPMAGCLPIVLQLPILWGFYNLLSRAIELRGAPWILWIRDLSDKDPTYILPILMTATMFIQTYITPSTGDPAQRRIFLIMPLVFGFLFKDFPSGLVLYWLVQNVLTIIQQLIMNKWWKEHPQELQSA